MSLFPHRHPSDETLLRFAAGTLGPGLRLVVAVHLESCPACREQIRHLQSVGGALLDSLPPAAISPALIERVFARIDSGKAELRPAPTRSPKALDGFTLPGALAGCDIGPWRFVHPKLRWARVGVPDAPRERVILLKIAPGCGAPAHGHGGLELTQVLYGAFSDGHGFYGPGDLVEADETVTDHQARATAESDCLCLAAMEKPLRIKSLIGRLIQPLVGL